MVEQYIPKANEPDFVHTTHITLQHNLLPYVVLGWNHVSMLDSTSLS